MAKAEDLTGKEFGFLKVIERTEDHVSKSGQKKVRWTCECKLCGNRKDIIAQDLKNGKIVSCGCYQAYKGKQSRNKKKCIICGKDFECPPSENTVTCSNECRKKYASIRVKGRTVSDATKGKLSAKAKGRDMSELQQIATEAAKNSPKSGRFITNQNALDWHLVSPDGKSYCFHSLSLWLRENGEKFFGCKPDSKEFNNAKSGLCAAKHAFLGGTYNCSTYKGWQVIPTESDNNKIKDK